MNLLNKKAVVTSFILIAAVISATAWFAFADDLTFRPDADVKYASELSALSGLPSETILRLYDSVGSWEAVRQNLFVFRRILGFAQQDTDAYDKVFDLASKFKADEMLTVYEYAYRCSNNFDLAEQMLEKHSGGTSLENVLAEAETAKPYKVYKPAGEEQIRQWLNEGYIPQDVLSADELARAKDMDIAAVLALKNSETNWQDIGQKLSYKFEDEQARQATINVQGVTGNLSFKGRDYEAAINQANKKAEEQYLALEDKVRQDYGVTKEQMQAYKEKGFTVRDIQNAARLSQKSGTPLDKILQERTDGKSWEEVIQTYDG